ncbi:antitoxin [Salmonella enterica subsp. enterica serovar Oranienburg]|nr:antitoxin [Salmonella enterica subsp. enterica serovar Oranienburg]HAK8205117.1 antitoxin [Salmonella enterica]
MSTALSPIVSEFETVEQEASYNEWLRAKVAESLADPRPAIPHDEVMAEIDALIDQIAAGIDNDVLILRP